MTSVEVKIDNLVTRQSGPYCFKIQGELYYFTGALLSHGNQTPIYISLIQQSSLILGGPTTIT